MAIIKYYSQLIAINKKLIQIEHDEHHLVKHMELEQILSIPLMFFFLNQHNQKFSMQGRKVLYLLTAMPDHKLNQSC